MRINRTTEQMPRNQKQSHFKEFFTEQKFDELSKRILPRKLLLPLTNRCNANCVFCAYQYLEEPKMFMEEEVFESAVKQFVALHPESFVSFTPTVGDLLLDKNFLKRIQRAKELGVKMLQFYTNAILLEPYVDEIISSGLDHLEISMADFNREEYLAIYRVDRYPQVLKGLSLLLRKHAASSSKMSININLRPRRSLELIKKEYDYQREVAPFLNDLVTLTVLEEFDNWTGLITADQLFPSMPLMEKSGRKSLPCSRLFDLQVMPKGEVRICGSRIGKTSYDKLIIGNIKERSLEEIWFSEKVLDLRRGFFRDEVPDNCRDCSFYNGVGNKRFYMKDV